MHVDARCCSFKETADSSLVDCMKLITLFTKVSPGSWRSIISRGEGSLEVLAKIAVNCFRSRLGMIEGN